MFARFARVFCAALCASYVALAGASAHAALFSFSGLSADGHSVAASANFAFNAGADTIAVTLTNTTATTLDAGELFSAVDFNLGGLTPSLVSASGIQRTVDGTGAFVDTGSAQPLSWSIASSGGGTYSLNFNPDAKDAVIGPPSSGSYAGASGSINGNGGHNPFAAQVAQFVLSVPNLEANTPISMGVFRFGTTLAAATGQTVENPEPSSAALAAAAGLTCLAFGRRRVVC